MVAIGRPPMAPGLGRGPAWLAAVGIALFAQASEALTLSAAGAAALVEPPLGPCNGTAAATAALGGGLRVGMLRVRLRRHKGRARPASSLRRPKALLQLSAATSSESAAQSLPGQGEEHLFGSIFVGVPRQEFLVAFDTFSGNLILPSRLCQSSPCLSHRTYDGAVSGTAKDIGRADEMDIPFNAEEPRETVRLNVGSGTVVGQLMSDRLCLGEEDNLCAQTAFIEATEMSEEPFGFLPYDGILGLGMPGASLEKPFNFLGNLAQAGVLELDRFAVWLALPSDGEDSEITFGAFDDARVASDNVIWRKIVRTETGVWQLPLSDVVVDGQDQKICEDAPCWAGFDTGTTVIGGPRAIIEPLLLRLEISKDCSNFRNLPMIGFVLGDHAFNLEPADYVKKTSAGCFHQFLVVDLPPPRGPMVLLGEPFLRRFYTVFDRPTLKIGLSVARHKAGQAQEKELAAKFITMRQAPAPTDD